MQWSKYSIWGKGLSAERWQAFEKLNLLIHVHHLDALYEPRHEISNNVVCATSKGSDQPAHTRRLIGAFACRLCIL